MDTLGCHIIGIVPLILKKQFQYYLGNCSHNIIVTNMSAYSACRRLSFWKIEDQAVLKVMKLLTMQKRSIEIYGPTFRLQIRDHLQCRFIGKPYYIMQSVKVNKK